MVDVIFYGKPGCASNRKQKSMLTAAGVNFEERDLLLHPWNSTSLRAFFGTTPVAQWFNASSPRVKNGEIDPARLTEEEALAAMLIDPLLIRRPLLEIAQFRTAGFDWPLLAARLGVAVDPTVDAPTESCSKMSGHGQCRHEVAP